MGYGQPKIFVDLATGAIGLVNNADVIDVPIAYTNLLTLKAKAASYGFTELAGNRTFVACLSHPYMQLSHRRRQFVSAAYVLTHCFT